MLKYKYIIVRNFNLCLFIYRAFSHCKYAGQKKLLCNSLLWIV